MSERRACSSRLSGERVLLRQIARVARLSRQASRTNKGMVKIHAIVTTISVMRTAAAYSTGLPSRGLVRGRGRAGRPAPISGREPAR